MQGKGSHGVRLQAASSLPPVSIINPEGTSRFLLVCDHASNRIPPEFGNLGLTLAQRLRHIAWDPGALAVALELSELLDAPLVHSTVSRLVVDCNRAPDAPDLCASFSEDTEILGNTNLSDDERRRRIGLYHDPFHGAIEAQIESRRQRGIGTGLVAVHSFTPAYLGSRRPWPIGLVHAADPGFSKAIYDSLAAEFPEIDIGWNLPYATQRGVTYTLEHHGDGKGIEATMLEIRHDEILEQAGISLWARRLARCLTAIPMAERRGHKLAAQVPGGGKD